MVLVVHVDYQLLDHELLQLFQMLRRDPLDHVLFAQHAIQPHGFALDMEILWPGVDRSADDLELVPHVLVLLEDPLVELYALLGAGFDGALLVEEVL